MDRFSEFFANETHNCWSQLMDRFCEFFANDTLTTGQVTHRYFDVVLPWHFSVFLLLSTTHKQDKWKLCVLFANSKCLPRVTEERRQLLAFYYHCTGQSLWKVVSYLNIYKTLRRNRSVLRSPTLWCEAQHVICQWIQHGMVNVTSQLDGFLSDKNVTYRRAKEKRCLWWFSLICFCFPNKYLLYNISLKNKK